MGVPLSGVITIRALAWLEHARAPGRIVIVPELPEVESLARFLRQAADGHVIDRADSAAISVLKTYRPDLGALHGRVISDTQRHGKFLDLVAVPPPGSADGSHAAGGS